jgi:RND family efflux transporter MFP subunit
MKQIKVKWILGAFAIIFLILMLFYLQGIIGSGKIVKESAHEMKIPDNIETLKITKVSIGQNVKFVGSICSKTRATISSKVVARIEKIFVKSGDEVKKDDKMIQLESKDINAKLQQTNAALDAAKSNLAQAKADYDRYKNLFDDKTITKQEFERAETGYKTAQAQVDQSENAKKEAEAFLGYALIKAPFDGLIVKKEAEEGDMASPGTPIITMYDPKDIWFESQVPESQASIVVIGLDANVNVDSINKQLKGKIIEVVPAVDPASRTVTVRIEIPKESSLRCGMYGNFELLSGAAEAILIPTKAVKKVGQLDSVYVITNGKLRMRNISLGRDYGDKVEVSSGLSEGEEVVINPDVIKEAGE